MVYIGAHHIDHSILLQFSVMMRNQCLSESLAKWLLLDHLRTVKPYGSLLIIHPQCLSSIKSIPLILKSSSPWHLLNLVNQGLETWWVGTFNLVYFLWWRVLCCEFSEELFWVVVWVTGLFRSTVLANPYLDWLHRYMDSMRGSLPCSRVLIHLLLKC